jgi:hypothetical protein
VTRQLGVLLAFLALAAPAGAGELWLVNGSRLQADLANEQLLVSTGADLVEVAPDSVGLLTRNEVRLKDGRILHGTLVGGRVRARTALGELAIDADELRVFRADVVPAKPLATPVSGPAPAPAPATEESPAVPAPAAPVVASATTAAVDSPRPTATPRLEVVVADTTLRRDAVATASPVGAVYRGERVTYVDSIDRRLRILNTLIFDGGHWIKVQANDGTVGWLPADTVREVR